VRKKKGRTSAGGKNQSQLHVGAAAVGVKGGGKEKAGAMKTFSKEKGQTPSSPPLLGTNQKGKGRERVPRKHKAQAKEGGLKSICSYYDCLWSQERKNGDGECTE